MADRSRGTYLATILAGPGAVDDLLFGKDRSSHRHEAVLFLFNEPRAPVARLNRADNAKRVWTAKIPAVDRRTGIPITTKAYTGPTTGLWPGSS